MALSKSRLAILEEVGGPEFVGDLLRDFMGNFEQTLIELNSCLINQDAKRIAYLCHATRSSGANVGASFLADACERLEDRVMKSSVDWNEARLVFNEIASQAPTLKASILDYP